MQELSKLTMVLPIFNEENRIERVIDYYKNFGKILIIDNYSTDNSIKILKEKFSNEITIEYFKNNGTIQTSDFINFVKSRIKTKYIILLSASEFIPPKLIHEFFNIAAKQSYGLVSNVVDSYTCGIKIPLWGGRFEVIDRRIQRFMNLDELDIENVYIHRDFTIKDCERILNMSRSAEYTIHHIRDADTTSLIFKHLNYANAEADQLVKSGGQFGIGKLMSLFLREILRLLHLHPKHWSFITIREIMARIAMHTFIYFITKEISTGQGIKYSHEMSELKWNSLTKDKTLH